MDSRMYRHFFGQYPVNSVFHHYFPSHNMLSIEALKEKLKESEGDTEDTSSVPFGSAPYYEDFMYDKCVSRILHSGSGMIDRARDLVKKKFYWNEKLVCKKPRKINEALRDLCKIKKEGMEDINSSLAKYLNWFNEDPLPGFKDDYNWLYTGGNIAAISMNDNHWIITPDEIHGSTALNIMKLDLNSNWKKTEQNPHYLSKNDPVLQISYAYKNNEVLVAARQKDEITLFTFDDEFRLTGADYCQVKGSGILTSSALNPEGDKLAVTDSNLKISIFDVNFGTCIKKQLHMYGEKQWSQVLFHDENVLCFADRSSVRLFDLRSLSSRADFVYKPSAVINNCELICSMIRSERRDDLYYIATSHNLIEADIRTGNNIQRWTHLMKFAPQFGRAYYRDNEELIVLQSEKPYEIVGILNESNSKNVQFTSQTNPYILRSIKQDVRLAQHSGACLQPFINERFSFTVTGLEILGSEAGPDVFTVNGGGDVILNRLRRNSSVHTDDSSKHRNDVMENLEEYRSHFLDLQSSKSLIATAYPVDVSSLAKDLRKKDSLKKKRKQEKFVWPYQESCSPESLCYYKDMMSERILSVWGISTKDLSDEIHAKEPVVGDEMTAKDKIEKWMRDLEHGRDTPDRNT
ncbi:UNVERIFIED_CONTAM: hypothetical protein PYX00_002204 [Menopon gallinae]|uniref:Uncharacterized protein n=1 Tax=Menopon gallinae TaxID=328185 RepID=A0AAW2IH76_9NEOP